MSFVRGIYSYIHSLRELTWKCITRGEFLLFCVRRIRTSGCELVEIKSVYGGRQKIFSRNFTNYLNVLGWAG